MEYKIEKVFPSTKEEKEGSVLLWRQEDDKFILLARHDMYVMNEFSKEIFDLCDGEKTIKDLIQHCVDQYSVEFEAAKKSIVNLIEFAVSKNLMEITVKDD